MHSKNKSIFSCTLANKDVGNKSKGFTMKPDTNAQIYIIT